MTGRLGNTLDRNAEYRHVYMVPECRVEELWPVMEDLLNRSRLQWEPFYTLTGIRNRVENGSNQFWIVSDAGGPFIGMLTEIVEYETGLRDLKVLWLGGYELKHMEQYFFIAENWARVQKCDTISAVCRPAIKKLMNGYGMKARSYIINKTVNFDGGH